MSWATTVLMYHAIRGADGRCADADERYAVDRVQFASHLNVAVQAGKTPVSVASQLGKRPAGSVAFTFDDGHASNAWAADALAAVGASADFFVNSSTVGTRGHLSWTALRDMAAAGMSIQSHGHRHCYLDDMTRAEVEAELTTSKQTIEDKLGKAVDLFAPPGGRLPRDMHLLALNAGYAAVCSSRVDLWRPSGGWDVPRLAVLHETSDAQLGKWVAQDRWELLRSRSRYRMLSAAKRLLGNGSYERLRHGVMRLGRAR